MKTWKKVLIGVGGLLLALILVGIGIHQANKGVVTVQTGKAQREDLASVVTRLGRNQAEDLRQHRGQCVWKDHSPLCERR